MHKNQGFSLLELLIVLAIMGVIASVAIPAYSNYTKLANRKAAQQFLLAIANKEEQYMLDARSYTDVLANLNLSAPPELTGKYTFAIAVDNSATPPEYTITATPAGSMSGTNNQVLDNTGTKTPISEW